jgi:pyruvate/2-oxoglutarate/acetoin dehydrogenase E1 component
MAELARQAMLTLAYEHEIFTELLVPTDLTANLKPETCKLLTVEESTLTLGWGAEVIARATESLGPRLKAARRVAARETPIPASGPLEAATLPGVAEIVQAARMMV